MPKKLFLRTLILQLIATMALCHSIGCQKANPEGRENVSGTITLNGKPIDPKWNASITFVPSDGRDVDDGGGEQIAQGRYLLTGIGGVKPGKYKVKLYVTQYYDIKTSEPSTEATGEFDNIHVSMIPNEFNENSTLEFEVVQGKKNIFNYDIVTDFVPDVESAIKRARNRPPI